MTSVLSGSIELRFLATALVCAGVVLPRLTGRWPLWILLLWRIAVFLALTVLVLNILGSPLAPHFTASQAGMNLWAQFIEACWWVSAAGAIVGLGRAFVALENRPRETQIVSDLMAGAVYVATLLAVINFAFGVPIQGLLATSGVIAIVLGLALQSTLSDVFSGIVVGIERPYQAGDLLWVEGDVEGYVVQVNWRSTHIATAQHNIAIVPNSIIAKSRLVNRSAPTPLRGDAILVSLDVRAVSADCLAALEAASRACRLISEEPKPNVACTGLNGDGVAYQISFCVDSTEHLRAARAELYVQVHRHLRYAGIALAIPNDAAPPNVAVPTLVQLLEWSDLFCVLAQPDRELFAEHFSPISLEAGQTLIRQGESPEALFVIATGTVEITSNAGGRTRIIHRMGPGESLGVVSLITGIAYGATATALTPAKAYRLGKPDIAAMIKAHPDLMTSLEVLAKRGQAALSRSPEIVDESHQNQPEMFLPKLRRLLHRLASS